MVQIVHDFLQRGNRPTHPGRCLGGLAEMAFRIIQRFMVQGNAMTPERGGQAGW